jgi:bacteriocin-like protein
MKQNFMEQELSDDELEQVVGGCGHHYSKPQHHRHHGYQGHEHKHCFDPHFHHEYKQAHCHSEHVITIKEPCH